MVKFHHHATCTKGPDLFFKNALNPIAVNIAEAVAETYATPNCVVLNGDLALRFVKFTNALND